MRVQTTDPALMRDLAAYLRAAECAVRETDETTVLVSVPRAATSEEARHDVEVYLAAWRAMHPGAQATVLD